MLTNNILCLYQSTLTTFLQIRKAYMYIFKLLLYNIKTISVKTDHRNMGMALVEQKGWHKSIGVSRPDYLAQI